MGTRSLVYAAGARSQECGVKPKRSAPDARSSGRSPVGRWAASRRSSSSTASRRPLSPSDLPQDLLHRPSFCQLVDQLVEITNALHDRVLNLLNTDTAYRARHERARGIHPGFGNEGLDVRPLLENAIQLLLGVASQPADDLVDLGFRASLFFGFRDIVRIDTGKTHRVDALERGTIGLHGDECYRTQVNTGPGRAPGLGQRWRGMQGSVSHSAIRVQPRRFISGACS